MMETSFGRFIRINQSLRRCRNYEGPEGAAVAGLLMKLWQYISLFCLLPQVGGQVSELLYW